MYRITLYLACGAALLFAACQTGTRTPSSRLAVSALQYDVSYSADSPPTGGKLADGNSPDMGDSVAITVTFVPMSAWPENTLEPVESQTRMITVLPASSAVTAVAGLLRKARAGVIQSEAQIPKHGTVGHPAALVPEETLHGVLPKGVGASFRILARSDADASAIPKLEIQVRRGLTTGEPPRTGISLEVSLAATGQRQTAAGPEADGAANAGKKLSASVASGMPVTETILLKPLDLQEQDRLAVLLPSPFDVAGIAAFMALIEVKPPPQKGTSEAATYAALLKECQDDLRAEAEDGGGQGGPRFDAGRPGIEDAIRLVQSLTHRRQALLYLAREAGAPLVEDITLSSTDVVIDRLAYAVTNECESGPAIEPNTLGWRLQKTAYLLLADLTSADQAWPELEAIAIRYGGEVGRHPAVLKEMVSQAANGADLEQRLLLENSIYLEDISPAARSRAFEWLTARGRAPQGYDPLASLKERRSVLNRVQKEPQ